MNQNTTEVPKPTKSYLKGYKDCKNKILKIIEESNNTNLMSSYQLNEYCRMVKQIENV